jgi:hypothetical protein
LSEFKAAGGVAGAGTFMFESTAADEDVDAGELATLGGASWANAAAPKTAVAAMAEMKCFTFMVMPPLSFHRST